MKESNKVDELSRQPRECPVRAASHCRCSRCFWCLNEERFMINFTTLEDTLISEIQDFQKSAASSLKIDLNSPPKSIVEQINKWAQFQKQSQIMPDENLIIGVGVLLNEQYVREFGWHWSHLGDEETPDDTYTGVLSPENRYMINGIWWVNDVLQNRNSVNFLLGFNMFDGGNVPHALPNQALGLM
jgi:hypothetical protein